MITLSYNVQRYHRLMITVLLILELLYTAARIFIAYYDSL